MASKLNPWGICRNLTIRSRPLLSSTERRIAFPIARRALSNDTTSRPSGDSDSSVPPPVPTEYVPPPPELFAPNWLNAEALARLEKAAAGEDLYDEDPGHKFGMPELPGKDDQLQHRYPEVVDQVTKLLMRDGKLSVAQRVLFHNTRRCKKTRLTRRNAEYGPDPQLPPHFTGTKGQPSEAPSSWIPAS